MKTRSQKRKKRSQTRPLPDTRQTLAVDERVKIHGRSEIFPGASALVVEVIQSKHGQKVRLMLPHKNRLIVLVPIEHVIRNVAWDKDTLERERKLAREEASRVYFFEGLNVSVADRVQL